jgi:hypothetical protein
MLPQIPSAIVAIQTPLGVLHSKPLMWVNQSKTASMTMELSNNNVGHNVGHCNIVQLLGGRCHPSDTVNISTSVGLVMS